MLATEIASGRAVHGFCLPRHAARQFSFSAHCRLPRRAALLCHASEVKAPVVRLDFETSEGPTALDCESGDVLRDVMLAQKVDLYTTWGKVWSCGGNGQCGTCIVKVQAQLTSPLYYEHCCSFLRTIALPLQIIDGSALLSDRNPTEDKKLKRVSVQHFHSPYACCIRWQAMASGSVSYTANTPHHANVK